MLKIYTHHSSRAAEEKRSIVQYSRLAGLMAGLQKIGVEYEYQSESAIVEGDNLDNSPYKFGGSRFFELGWAWKTRVFKNSNFLRFKYGYSLQINGLKPDDNQYFTRQDNQTVLEVFPENLRKSKLSITNLVFPVHFWLR